MNSQEKELVNQVLDKYEKKYAGAQKMLFLIPNPFAAKKKMLLEHYSDKLKSEQMILLIITQILLQKDLYTTEYIAPENIISIDLNSLNMCFDSEIQETYKF